MGEAHKKNAGRKKVELDMEALKKACMVGCTQEDCANILQVSVRTIERRLKDDGWNNFDEFFKSHFDLTKQSLRHWQIQAARGGNVTMMIWLGKQFLSQRDKADLDVDGGLTINWDKDLEGI